MADDKNKNSSEENIKLESNIGSKELGVDKIVTITSKDEIYNTNKKHMSEKEKTSIEGKKPTKSTSSEIINTMTKQKQKSSDKRDDAFLIDYSTLMNLPRSVIQEAIEYAKRQRREEEDDTKEQYIRLKCIPPWAKSYGGKRLDICVHTGTQYITEDSLTDKEKRKSSTKQTTKSGTIEEQITEEEEEETDEEDEIEGEEEEDESSVSEEETEREVEEGKENQGDEEYPTKEAEEYEEARIDQAKMTTSIGFQIQPSTNIFGQQTGRDSLTEVTKSDEKLKSITGEKKYSQIFGEGEESSGLMGEEALLQQMIAAETTDDKDKLSKLDITAEDLAKLSSEERMALAEGTLTKETVAQLLEEKDDIKGSETEGETEGHEHYEDERLSEEKRMAEEGKIKDELDAPSSKKPEEEEYGSSGSTIDSVVSGEDSSYLHEQLGRILAVALAEIAWKRPGDPVHYLAHKLYSIRRQQQVQSTMVCDINYLQQEKERLLQEPPIKKFGVIATPIEKKHFASDRESLEEEESLLDKQEGDNENFENLSTNGSEENHENLITSG